MTAIATMCPHCHRDLAATQRGKHCRPEDSKTCTWIKHDCGATVDPYRGNHICGDQTPCEDER